MKKIIALVLALIMVLSLTACSGGLTMGTGSSTGTYYAYGGVLASTVKAKADIDVKTVTTDGSKANIQGIDAGLYQLGTVQSDVLAYAWAGTSVFQEEGKVESFRVIAGLYDEAVQLVTTDPTIKSVADLKGKSVSIGAANSGVYFNAMDILKAAGMTIDDIKPQYQNFDASAEALKDGKINAAFIVAGAPTPAITELCQTNSAWIVPIDGALAEKLMADCAYYQPYKIPAGTYKGQDKDVNTITIKATLICSADLSEDQVYSITASIFDNIESITKAHAKGNELSLENATCIAGAPYHKGAAKYFAEKGIDVESK